MGLSSQTRVSIYKKGLIEIGEYYHRPACELIFLTKTEHTKIHKKGNKNCIGKYHSEDTKKRMSKAKAGNKNPFFGKHLSKEHKDKISKAKIGNHNAPTKPILQYTKDGEFIREWTSGIEASRVLGIHGGNIISCCKGTRKSAGGFVWAYVNDKLFKVSSAWL